MEEGLAQGDPPSGDLFAIGLQPVLKELDRICAEGGGETRAGHDDIFVQGPSHIVVVPAVIKFADSIKNRCNLKLQWAKSSIFSWSGVLPD